jgi:hypothetical protein
MIQVQDKPEVEWDSLSRIYTENNVLNSELCDAIMTYGKKNLKEGINKYPDSFSICFESCLLPIQHEVHVALQDTWDRVIKHIGFDAQFVELYELKRYEPQDHFGLHTDNYYGIKANLDRKITMSIQLNDRSDYVGGYLTVAKRPFKLTKGSIIAFPSFFPHEVTPIIKGDRWSLINWAWGPYWR